jgi:hypothetical protein
MTVLLKTIACGHACRHYRSLRDRCRAGVSFPFAGRNPGSEIGKACHLAPNHHRCLWSSNASERYRRHRREVIVIRRSKFERRMTRSHELYFFRFRMISHGFSQLSRRSVDTMASFRRETAQAALPRAQRSLAQRSTTVFDGQQPLFTPSQVTSWERSVTRHAFDLEMSSPRTGCSSSARRERVQALSGEHRLFRGPPVSKQEFGCRARQCSALPRALVAPNMAEMIEARPPREVSLDLRSLEVSINLFDHPLRPLGAEATKDTGAPLSPGQRLHSRLA